MQYIHLSEYDRGTLGTDNLNREHVFQSLAAMDHEECPLMEPSAAINDCVAGAIAPWRGVISGPDALKWDGLAFLRDMARKYCIPTGRA